MASVSELVEDIAEVMGQRVETVNAYARALIDAGMLPKSRGRAVAQVSIEHIVKLFLAVILEPKIKDVASAVEAYYTMPKPGVTANFPQKMRDDVAGAELVRWVSIIWSGTERETEEDRDFRLSCLDAHLCVNLNWEEIEIDFHTGIIRFKRGGSPGHWDGYYKRQVIVSGRAFMMLGSGKGRDYPKAAQ